MHIHVHVYALSVSLRECLEKSLDIFESLFGDEDIRVATVLTHLGSTWRSLGDSKTSKRLFERALSIQQDVLEPLHPSVSLFVFKQLHSHLIILNNNN